MIDHATVKVLSGRLIEAARSRVPCAPLVETHPDLTIEDAYAIQAAVIDAREADGPSRLIGHKIGLTSEAVQSWLKVNEPDFGRLHAAMETPHGGVIEAASMLQPRAEGEIAFVLGADLPTSGVTASEVIGATAYVLPAIEVVDSRVADWNITIVDTVADNASAGRFVLGTRPTHLSDVDLELLGMRLAKNGRVVSTGAGAACMDSPIHAVAWLANTVGRFDQTLREGDVILSGALGPVTPVTAGDHLVLEIATLGQVAVRFT